MKSRSDATSWTVVLIAATSLALMITLYQIDLTIRGAVSEYGLQFSPNWAATYWRLMQVGFALGWINISTALVVQANNIRMKRKAEQSTDAIKDAWKIARLPETETGSHEEEAEEHKEPEPTKPDEKEPTINPEPEAQENREEPQQPKETQEQAPQPPNETPEQEPQLPRTN